MNVYYVTYPSKKPWCSDFTAKNLAQHSENIVYPTNSDQLNGIHDSIIHFHNVQILGRWIRPKRFIEKMHEHGNKIIAGLRGRMGYGKYDELLRQCDAVSVGVDMNLMEYAESLNQNVYMLPPGEDPDKFKQLDIPKSNILCWVGRDHKDFKNAKLLEQLNYQYTKATYNNYIPHEELPTFYNSAKILVGFSKHEGFWRPCIEAAMCNLPILSTNVGVVREIVDADCIIPHPAKNFIHLYQQKIKYLLDDPEYAAKLGKMNRERALRYSWDKVVPLHDKAWREVYEN